MQAMPILPGLVALGLAFSSFSAAAQNVATPALRHGNAQADGTEPATVGETRTSEKQESRTSAKESKKKPVISNVMKTKHDTAKSSINNVR